MSGVCMYYIMYVFIYYYYIIKELALCAVQWPCSLECCRRVRSPKHTCTQRVWVKR